jgi:tetratricopeptide (TPR) repeat protein
MASIPELLSIALQRHRVGHLQEAEGIYRAVLAQDANQVDAWHLLGLIAGERGEQECAIEWIGRALALRPDFAEAHYNLGRVYQQVGNLEEAVACYRRSIGLRPDYAEAYKNLGLVRLAQGATEEALGCFRRMTELRPDYAEGHLALGNALKDAGKAEEAIDCFRRALQLSPSLADAENNLGSVYEQQGRFGDARSCYRRAMALDPHHAEAHWNDAALNLLHGEFEIGWIGYEWRWRTREMKPRAVKQSHWAGEPLAGRTILLHAEQGLGDTIQFIRYAALVKQRGCKVIVECQRRLAPLLRSCRGIDLLVPQGDEWPPFDVHAPLLSLPRVFRTTLASIPTDIPYLSADAGLVREWRGRLPAAGRVLVGINWHGEPGKRNSRQRAIPRGMFESLAAVPGVRLIGLQKAEVGDQRSEQFKVQSSKFKVEGEGEVAIVDLGEIDTEHGAFMDTAAIMMNLDLVITSDTSVAHLAGALGVPVWVALPFVPDWRWLLERSDSPWYPSMRLFRQKKRGDWAGIFEEIEAGLRERVSGSKFQV